MRDFTAAHPSLPLGTLVKVTNLRNGKAVVVRINDRGPVVDDRIIDVSYSAAQALGFKRARSAEGQIGPLPACEPANKLPADHSGAATTRSQPRLNPINSGDDS
jgi:rare lipoprotein A